MLASFDVFDTLITRHYAIPEDLLLHLGEILAEQGLTVNAASFTQARFDAEAEAWKNRGRGRGAAIDEIYAILAKRLSWNEAQMEQAMREEIHLELTATRAVPDGVAGVEQARQRGHDVCFISDMHLRASHIRAMLAKTGIIRDHDALFVSSDVKVLKSTGDLFRKALGELKIAPGHSYHTGDSPQADYRGAKRIGMRATLYTRAHLNRFEKATLTAIERGNWRLRTLAAVSKSARLAGPTSPLRELLVSTIAPFVSAYALWLITQAAKRGIRKLFFLARDMQIVHAVTELLAAKLAPDLTCHYIHASRQSWQPAGYSGPDDHALFWLTDNLGVIDPQRVLRRLLSVEDVDRVAALCGGLASAGKDWNRERIRALLESGPVRPFVENAAREKRALLLTYLAHCGYDQTMPLALVDTGWRGSLQKCLARAFRMEGIPAQTIGFYVGLRHAGAAEAGSTLTAFLPDELVGRLGFSLGAVIEALLISNHGSTIGYAMCNGKPQALQQPEPNETVLAQWRAVRESCLTYAEELSKFPAWDCPKETLIGPLTIPMILFCERPLVDESRLFREWVFDRGRDKPEYSALVGRLSLRDFAKLVRARLRSQPLADVYLSSPWLHGAIAAAPWPQRMLAKWLSRC